MKKAKKKNSLDQWTNKLDRLNDKNSVLITGGTYSGGRLHTDGTWVPAYSYST